MAPTTYYRSTDVDSRPYLRSSSPLAQHVEFFDDVPEPSENGLKSAAPSFNSKYLAPPTYSDYPSNAQHRRPVLVWRDSEKGLRAPTRHRRLDTATLIQLARRPVLTPQRLLTLFAVVLAGSYFARLLPVLLGPSPSTVYVHHEQAYRPAAYYEPMPASTRSGRRAQAVRKGKSAEEVPRKVYGAGQRGAELMGEHDPAARRLAEEQVQRQHQQLRGQDVYEREAGHDSTLFEDAFKEEDIDLHDALAAEEDEELPGILLPLPLRGGSRAAGLRHDVSVKNSEGDRRQKVEKVVPQDQREEDQLKRAEAAALGESVRRGEEDRGLFADAAKEAGLVERRYRH